MTTFTPPPAPGNAPDSQGGNSKPRNARRAAVVGLGMLGAAAAAAVAISNAGADPAATPVAAYGAAGSGAPGAPGAPGGHRGPGGPGGHALDQTGTLTSVGTDSVTIKTSTGTTTYAVNADSDIDKNGEATLKHLVAGDAVRFSTTTVNGKATIRILHAGDEAKDAPARPDGPPPGQSGVPNRGTPPSGAPQGGGAPSGGTA